MPEIRSSAFFWGRKPLPLSAVPMLASMGCPYRCDFCIDWSSTYHPLPADRLRADLRYLAKHLPGRLVVFHDPNFAVKFDQVFETLEAQPPGERPPYIIESSLTVLRGDRPQRLKETNCAMVAPGVESWTDYSNKAGVGRTSGVAKVDRVAAHFAQLAENVPYLQANFMFGLDTDQGDQPVELTKRFMDLAPFAFPTINIPVPFGGTPLHDELAAGGRILSTMPFSFYYAPYLVTTIKHYDPMTYYEKLIQLYTPGRGPNDKRPFPRRCDAAPTDADDLQPCRRLPTPGTHGELPFRYRELPAHPRNAEVRSGVPGVPRGADRRPAGLYRHIGERMLGRYAELLSPADRTPDLSPAGPQPHHLTIEKR